jgi:hypothetical protein
MSIISWVCLALLLAYLIWLFTKKTRTTSYVFPAVITLVLGGVAWYMR